MQQRLPASEEKVQSLSIEAEVSKAVSRSTAARARYGGIFVIGFFLGALVLSVFYSEFNSFTTLRPATLHSVDPKSQIIHSGNHTIVRKHVEKTAYLKPGGELLPPRNATKKVVPTTKPNGNAKTETKVDIKKPDDSKKGNVDNSKPNDTTKKPNQDDKKPNTDIKKVETKVIDTKVNGTVASSNQKPSAAPSSAAQSKTIGPSAAIKNGANDVKSAPPTATKTTDIKTADIKTAPTTTNKSVAPSAAPTIKKRRFRRSKR